MFSKMNLTFAYFSLRFVDWTSEIVENSSFTFMSVKVKTLMRSLIWPFLPSMRILRGLDLSPIVQAFAHPGQYHLRESITSIY